MKIIPERQADWDLGLKNNQDSYGAAIYRYAVAWADLMEKRIDSLSLESPSSPDIGAIAKQASHDADTEGITGFMYGAAVSILSHAWIHGEALRRWHNLDTQLGTEGEKANDSGGVLNPALLNIG